MDQEKTARFFFNQDISNQADKLATIPEQFLNRDQRKMLPDILRAIENDRKAVALDIHDSVCGSLAGIKMLLECRVARARKSPPKSITRLEEIVGHLADTIKETRRIIFQLNGKSNGALDLRKVIFRHIATFQKYYPDIAVNVRFEDTEENFSEEIKLVVFRVVQEALNNIGKHSGARSVDILLKKCASRVLLKVKDNGCGFDARLMESGQPMQGIGISGMTERVQLMKGKFKLRSSPGKGTSVLMQIPVDGLPGIAVS